MPVVISLLRGINVGGHHQIKMDDLRDLYESLGLRNPRSYIQSGNVVFQTSLQNLDKVAVSLNEAIAKRYGFRADVVLRTHTELRALLTMNPFAARPVDPAKNLVMFLSGALTPDAAATICALSIAPEELHSDGRHLHGHFPEGIGRSKLPVLIEKNLKKLNIAATARNWNTVLKLLEMADGLAELPPPHK
jgi:uncharacterized protein (DUF1697 family)